MRFSIVAAVAAFSSTVLAQSIGSIPQCAQACFGQNLGTCGPVDFACVCGNKAVITPVSCCVFATCPKDDIQKTIDFAVTLCKANGIDVDTNPQCPTNGTASASASASASGTLSVSGITGSASRTAAAATQTGAAAPLQTGAGLGLGMAMAGLIAML